MDMCELGTARTADKTWVFDQVCSQNDWILALFFFVRVCLQTKIVFRHKITIFMRETADNPSG